MKAASSTAGSGRPSASEQGPEPPAPAGFDLMQVRPIRWLVQWAEFPRVLQWGMLVVMVSLSVISWHDLTPPGIGDKLYAKTHLGTLVIWGLWWPAMIWAAVWFGRAWCAVCPLELLGHLGEGATVALGRPGRPLPRWLAAGAGILALYGLLQMLVPGVHLHRVPAYTAYYLIGLMVLALLVGLVFRDRAFCRGFCPVGLLLGTYGRGGMLAVRPGSMAAGRTGAAPDARSCPSLLNPSRLNRNADCLGCVHCFKGAPPGSMRLLLRRPFAAADERELQASWPITGFVMVASGFVISELCSESPAAKKIFTAPPQWVAAQLGWPAGGGWIEGVWTLVVVPAVVWLVLAAALRLSGEKGRLPDLWQRLALPVAVVVAAGHMSKALAKFVSWIPFLPGAWRDPAGVETARAITQKAVPAPVAWVPLSVVTGIGLVLLVAALVVAIREYRLARRGQAGAGRGAWPLSMLAAGFAGLIASWG